MSVKTSDQSAVVRMSVFDTRVEETQALINLVSKVTDPGFVDGKYGKRTNAAVGSYINNPDNKIPSHITDAYVPNTAGGELGSPVSEKFVSALYEQLVYESLVNDRQFRATAIRNAIGILEKESTNSSPDRDDVRSAQVLGNLLMFQDAGGQTVRFPVTGTNGPDNASLLQALKTVAEQENLPAAVGPHGAAASSEEAEALQKELGIAQTKLEEAEIRNSTQQQQLEDARKQLAGQKDIGKQFSKATEEQSVWNRTLEHADFLQSDKSDAKLSEKYCDLFKQSFCVPEFHESDSPAERAAKKRNIDKMKTDMEQGRLLLTDEGHVIYMRMNPKAEKITVTENGVSVEKERHSVLAYDITKYINKTVGVAGGGREPRLNGLENLKFVEANIAQGDDAFRLALAKNNKDGTAFDRSAGVLVDIKGGGAHFHVLARDMDGDGHAESLRLIGTPEFKAHKDKYDPAFRQTPEAVRLDMTQRGPRERENLAGFNDVQTFMKVDPSFTCQDAVDMAADTAPVIVPGGEGGSGVISPRPAPGLQPRR